MKTMSLAMLCMNLELDHILNFKQQSGKSKASLLWLDTYLCKE